MATALECSSSRVLLLSCNIGSLHTFALENVFSTVCDLWAFLIL